MRTDTYTKVVLTIVASMLALIGCKTVISPGKTASAEGPFAGVQFTSFYSGVGVYVFFDPRTGEIWEYHRGELVHKYKIGKLGESMLESPLK